MQENHVEQHNVLGFVPRRVVIPLKPEMSRRGEVTAGSGIETKSDKTW